MFDSKAIKKKQLHLIIGATIAVVIVIILIFAIWSYQNQDFSKPRGELEMKKVTSTGAIISITSMESTALKITRFNSYYAYLDRNGSDGYLTLFFDPSSQELQVSEGITIEDMGSMEFVDIDNNNAISVGDEFRLGTEARAGVPLTSNETYVFSFDDDSDWAYWEIEFTTLAN